VNATEQKQRHTAVRTVEKQVDDLTTVMEAFARDLKRRDALTVAALDDVRKAADVRWLATAAAQKKIFDRWARVDSYTFWDRLRWLVVGR